MADDLAPAHLREQPAWITELVTLANSKLAKTVTAACKGIFAKKGNFICTVPLWVLGSISSA
jgi:hypothetical protein